MIVSTKLDLHSAIHFLGCYGLVFTFVHLFQVPVDTAAIIVIGLAATWEVLDEINHLTGLNIKFLDSRGGDVTDFIVSFVAV